MSTALDVSHLTVAFDGHAVLRDLSFGVETGSTLAIIGPNGSGKTVLFKALIGAVPSAGAIRWAPHTRVGYVPQKLDIARDLPVTGHDVLRAKADVSGTTEDDITRALGEVSLPTQIAGQPVGTLSGGQFQRLLLAFALMGHPSVLLFDEPTAGVDEPGEVGIYELFDTLQREEGLTVLLISHDLTLVAGQADAVLCLSHRCTYFGTPREVLTPERLQEAYGVPMHVHEHDQHHERHHDVSHP